MDIKSRVLIILQQELNSFEVFMDYQKIYNELIYKCQQRTDKPDTYCETHHIVPRSLGGNDEETNLVVLTAREHYIAHLLLCKITHGNDRYKMIWAFGSMVMKQQERQLNSYQFENARKALSQPKSQEHKDAISTTMKGTLYATHTIERIQVTNGETTQYVDKHELSHYINNGWRVGRKKYISDETYKNIANKNKTSFTLRTPEGDIITMHGLNDFCTTNNLSSACLSKVINGISQFHRGYSCPVYDDKFRNIEPLQQKKFKIREPSGAIVEIVGISQYCRDNNLDSGSLSRVLNGKAKQHKSYTAPEYDSKYNR